MPNAGDDLVSGPGPESSSSSVQGRVAQGENKNAVQLPPGLDSGDIVLFNRRCLSMPPAGAGLCAISKVMSNSRWDHVGIVVRDPRDGELLFLEADFGGVKLRSLEERVRRSKSNQIAVRRLSVVRTDAFRERLFSFAAEMLGRPYEIGTNSVMARVVDPVAKTERERLHALLIDKRAVVAEIDLELDSAALTATGRRMLLVERSRVAKVIDQIESKLIKELGGRTSMLKEAKDLSRVFCSELVAAAYQDVGLLDSYPLASSYNPKDFSSEQKNPPGVHLLKGARLSSELMLREEDARRASLLPTIRSLLAPAFLLSEERHLFNAPQLEKEAAMISDSVTSRNREKSSTPLLSKPRVRGVGSGDAPSRESRRLIREVLKRTPIYSKVPDEYKWSHLTKSFSARVVEAGDVVFSQGDYDDKLYVIESGAVDRFVSKEIDEDPVLVNSLGPRNSFGMTGFSFNCSRGATIRASEKTLLWYVDRPTFERFKDTSSSVQAILSEADQRALRGLLKHHFLFNRLDKLGPNELHEFFLVKFRAGEVIFKQGERGDNFYIIKGGEVERHIRHPRPVFGEEKENGDRGEEDSSSLATTLRPGQSFGELSLMYNAPRASTVRARTDTACWAISAESFHRLNLGHGTQYLRAIFERFASVRKDGEPYMTSSDLLNFADVAAFRDEACRKRLSALLVALVTSNRKRDPVQKTKPGALQSARVAITEEKDDQGEEEVLMDFWEFVRFDLVLNQPAAKMDFAFRLADQNNSGFISLDDLHYLLQDYADVDPMASDILAGKNKVIQKVFGRDGSRVVSAKEFEDYAHLILPPTFVSDLDHLVHHMLNMDPGTNARLMDDPELEELAFMEPDGSPSVMGSQFVGSTVPSARSFGPVASTSIRRRNPRSSRTFASNATSSESSGSRTDKEQKEVVALLPWAHLLSVGVSGTASRTMVAPLERLKILMQTQPRSHRYTGILSGFRAMFRDDTSAWRAMFRGNGANVLRIVPNAAIQLLVVDYMHRCAGTFGKVYHTDGDSAHQSAASRSKAVDAVVIGGVAGMIAAATTYPLDYVRGRLTLQHRGFERYRGAVDGLRKSIAEEGGMSIYRGLFPTLLGVFPYVGLSFAMYEMLRPVLPRLNDGSGRPTPSSAIIGGALASATGQFAAYPLDTIRRRMQVAGFAEGCEIGNGGVIQGMKNIVNREGIRGLFRGLTPNLLKVMPASAVSFLVYEQIRKELSV